MTEAPFMKFLWPTVRRIVGLACFLIPSSGMAQTPVRTGEHQGFSRMVVDFAERPDWRLGRTGNGYELRTEAAGRFDLGDVFRRLDAGRLADVRNTADGVLAFELGCRCRLKVFELPNQGLVIDIVDGPPPPDDPFEVALAQASSVDHTRQIKPAVTLPVLLSPLPPTLDYAALTESIVRIPSAPQAEDARRALLEQISHGMSQGLIALRDPLPVSLQRPVRTLEPQDVPVSERPDPTGSHLRIETQIDRDLRESGGGATQVSESSCIAATRVDVGDWFGTDLLISGTGPARMNLYDARDHPDPTAYGILARQFLYLSFGAEARSVLQSGPKDIRDAALLVDIAQILEGGVAPPASPLHGQVDCDTPAALWALLSQSMPYNGPLARNAVISTLSNWPLHLRQYLGPRVASALRLRGDRDGALAVRNAIERGSFAETSAATLMDAQLELDGGERQAAETKFEQVAASQSVEAAEAMIALLKSRSSDASPVASDLIESARALAFELRKTDMAAPLWSAFVRAQLHNDQVNDALLNLRDGRETGVIAPKAARALREDALIALSERADDAVFLRIALAELQIAPVAPPASLLIAERLAVLRMPAQARIALGDTNDVPAPRERILRARIALLEDEPQIAESYLAGLSDPEALALLDRARALPDARGLDASPAEQVGEQRTVPGVLAANRMLLNESRARRQQLTDLLQDASKSPPTSGL